VYWTEKNIYVNSLVILLVTYHSSVEVLPAIPQLSGTGRA